MRQTNDTNKLGNLQKVFTTSRSRRRHVSLIIADGAEKFECRFEVLANFADGRQIAAAVAVVWRTPDCDDVLFGEVVFVAFVHQLMSSCDEAKIVDMTKFFGDFVSK